MLNKLSGEEKLIFLVVLIFALCLLGIYLFTSGASLENGNMDTVDVYRMFTGREPKRTKVLRVPRGARLPAQVAQLGALRELQGYKGWGNGLFVQQGWGSQHGALLLSTSRGILYAYDPGGTLASIPNLRIVVYQTDKGRGSRLYVHEFSPGTKLIAVANTRGKFARIQGRYKIDSRGIVS